MGPRIIGVNSPRVNLCFRSIRTHTLRHRVERVDPITAVGFFTDVTLAAMRRSSGVNIVSNSHRADPYRCVWDKRIEHDHGPVGMSLARRPLTSQAALCRLCGPGGWGRRPGFHMHFNPNRLLLDQPGRALVRPAHRAGDPPRHPPVRPRTRSRQPRLDHRPEHPPSPISPDRDGREDRRITPTI